MTPLELLVILVLAGAIIVLLYFYLQDTQNTSLLRARSVITETGEKARSTVSGAGEKITSEGNGNGGVSEKMSGMGEKARTVVSGVGEKVTGTGEKVSGEGSMMEGVSEKVSGVGDKIKGTVKGVSKSTTESTDELSTKIDNFLNEKSSQIIKDWELATQTDIKNIEMKYNKVSRDLGNLDSQFNEHREDSNKKFKKIEERLNKIENPEK